MEPPPDQNTHIFTLNYLFPTAESFLKRVKYSEVKSHSHVQLFATPWTVAHQALPSMGFSRQEYWSGLPFPSPGDVPNPGIEPRSLALQADALTSAPPRFIRSLLLGMRRLVAGQQVNISTGGFICMSLCVISTFTINSISSEANSQIQENGQRFQYTRSQTMFLK